MAARKPLTEVQRTILIEIFHGRNAGPRSIATNTKISLSSVLRTLHLLRRKGYIAHDMGLTQVGPNNACYRPLRTLDGTPVTDFTAGDIAQKVAEYLKSHRITKLPPGQARGIHQSNMWDREL